MGKNRVMAAKHAKAKKMAVAQGVFRAIGYSIEDHKAGIITTPKDGMSLYTSHAEFMSDYDHDEYVKYLKQFHLA